jgi:hypothetical protein
MTLYNTIPERLKLITEQKCELSLAIEGRSTNLRIWQSHDHVYMRLDKANAYSVPLQADTISYLNKPNEPIIKLLKYGFESHTTNLSDILEITKGMKYRPCIEW